MRILPRVAALVAAALLFAAVPVAAAEAPAAPPLDAALAALARGEERPAARLLERFRDDGLARGRFRFPAEADRLFAAALASPTGEAFLAGWSERLDPDPRRPLALAAHRLRSGRPLDALAAGGRFLSLAADPAFRPLLFHLLLLLPLAAALAGAVRLFARLHLYRHLLLHERAETGTPLHLLDPDRFARLPDRRAKDGLYLAAGLLVVALFALLFVSVGPAGRLRRSLALARSLGSVEAGTVPLERLLVPTGVAPGTEAYLSGIEQLRRGDLPGARAAFLAVEAGSPLRTAATVGLAAAEHLAGSSEAALERLRPVAVVRDHPDLWLALYGTAQAAPAGAAVAAARDALAARPGGTERIVHLSTGFLAGGGRAPIPLAHDPAPLLDAAAARPGVATLLLTAFGVLSGLSALLLARVSFEAEPAESATRACAACGRVSCERCRVTVNLCPRCLEPIPGGVDPAALARHQFRRDAPPALLLSTFLFGFLPHVAGRHRAGWSLGAACFLAALLGRTVGALAGGLAPEPAALLAALEGWLAALFVALFLGQIAAGLLGPPAPPRAPDPSLARYRLRRR